MNMNMKMMQGESTMFLRLFLLLLLLSCIRFNDYAEASTTPIINLWPKPRNLTWSPPYQTTLLSSSFTIITTTIHRNKHLSAAISHYHTLIKSEHHHPLVPLGVKISKDLPPLQNLSIEVADPHAGLVHGVNESYTLSILPSHATLTAETVWGAMRGLETFSQLVWDCPTKIAVGVEVWDFPLFVHRGLLVDTARNYYPVKDLLRTVEAMSMNKLNVLHLHLTDAESFPLVLPSEPALAEKGAYAPHMVYTPEDVKTLVEFGLDHGVRVIPEIDTPGHTASWALGHPEIVTCANMFWWPAGSDWSERLASQPGTGHLNPLNPKTYQVLKNVIQDITTLFPEPFFHSGADEIVPGCWKTDSTIQKHLSNGGTLNQVLEKYINNTLPYIVSLNRTVIYWEDVLLDDTVHVASTILPKEHVILQTWLNGHDHTKKIVSAGYRTIVSSAEFYYLDCGHGTYVGNNSAYDKQEDGNTGNGGSWCAPFKTWQTIYNYDITYGLSEEEAKLVLGGEVALWSEQADASVLDGRVWPRASAMAESLWSGNRDEKGVKRYAEATDRLNEWRSRMVSRGIGAEPIQPLWCVKNPGMCNTQHPV
ncbi:beta-hexosaminidase 2-like isoform X2 [Vigna umbellata]|uniref:beta-hexosaminidase 2-like isoform X1 n=1 Tax=Vigna umbellata TaxID=87088 RepID=UPI001F5ECE04|nr:beta-hexosaminidase 2-like isoform X1 [Vigna umbellata]XP_047170907.1 beta-hexosaminidase 2-like isoform X2 [Vigna umbellata]